VLDVIYGRLVDPDDVYVLSNCYHQFGENLKVVRRIYQCQGLIKTRLLSRDNVMYKLIFLMSWSVSLFILQQLKRHGNIAQNSEFQPPSMSKS
jgi:hypothetical protein